MDDHQYNALQLLTISNSSDSTSFVRIGVFCEVRVSVSGGAYETYKQLQSGSHTTFRTGNVTNYPGKSWSNATPGGMVSYSQNLSVPVSPSGQAFDLGDGMQVSGDPALGTGVVVTCTTRMNASLNGNSSAFTAAFSVTAN